MSEPTFADLGVSTAVRTALTDEGFDAPFAIQTKVIGDVLAGRDVLAQSPTGSGKTLAFMVPLIDRIAAEARRPAALVLAPTRELAGQIVEASYRLAHSRALKIAAVYGGVGLERQGREAAKAHIVVATPGRLEDHLARRAFGLSHVEILVLDEADRMLDMGFRPAVDRIVGRCPSARQTLFFSATLDGEAGALAARYTQDAVTHVHTPATRRGPDIEHRFERIERTERVARLARHIGGGGERTIVFVRTKHGADRLVRHLARHDVAAVAMHGDKTQGQRERALAAFEQGRTTTLVATDVAARGIHVDDIATVVNFDPPGQAEDYTHRVGRTARAGERGVALTFVGTEHLDDVRGMVRTLGLQAPWAAATGEELQAAATRGGGRGDGGGSGGG
ncbi:MAG: DEAD/DEAH box helicase, partial [Miltoncostaeaceae bacterium]